MRPPYIRSCNAYEHIGNAAESAQESQVQSVLRVSIHKSRKQISLLQACTVSTQLKWNYTTRRLCWLLIQVT